MRWKVKFETEDMKDGEYSVSFVDAENERAAKSTVCERLNRRQNGQVMRASYRILSVERDLTETEVIENNLLDSLVRQLDGMYNGKWYSEEYHNIRQMLLKHKH